MSARQQAEAIFDSFLTRAYQEDAINRVRAEQKKIAPGWYAHSATIGMRTGPHPSAKKARECMRLSERARAKQRIERGTDYPYPHDLLVWQEKKK